MNPIKPMMLLGTFALFLLCSACCCFVAPAPIADENAAAIAEPIPFYRDLQAFSEKNVPLRYAVAAGKDNSCLAGFVANSLQRSGAQIAEAGQTYDAKVMVNSVLKSQKIVASEAGNRASLTIQLSLLTPQGTKVQDLWKTEVSDQKMYASEDAAKAALIQQFKVTFDTRNAAQSFLQEAENALAISVLRFTTSRNLAGFNESGFEADVQTVLDELRKMDGVLDVRMIEADKTNRIASFRIMYRKSAMPLGIAARIRENNAAKQKQ